MPFGVSARRALEAVSYTHLDVYKRQEKGYEIDEEGFKAAMDEQREKARSSREVTNYMGADATVYDQIDTSVTTEFVGYDHLSFESPVTVLTTEAEITDSLMEGQKGTVFVEKTPFYATMGGQVGDTGVIETANGKFIVEDTIKLRGGKFGHVAVSYTHLCHIHSHYYNRSYHIHNRIFPRRSHSL